jgi:hypothetical protein
MINGTPVAATTTDNKVYTFQPGQEGALTLTIDAEDDAGQGLDPAFPGASYTAKPPDTTPPTIDGPSCIPTDGDTNVEPADVTEIVIAFSEAMSDDLTVDLTEPADVLVDTELSSDKTKVTIKFLGGYSPGQETRFDISVTGSDLAGNALADGSYSFTTKAKEE